MLLKETAKGNLEMKSETPRKIQKYVEAFLDKNAKDAKAKAQAKSKAQDKAKGKSSGKKK